MMRTTAPIRSAWLGPTALLALAVLAAMAPDTAQAGCMGRLVDRTTGHGLGFAGLNELRDAGALADHGSPDAASPLPADAPAPCSGVFCSGGPAAPAEPLVAPIQSLGSWAILTGRPDPHEISSQPLPFDESRLTLTFLGLCVFHPPRSVASASV